MVYIIDSVIDCDNSNTDRVIEKDSIVMNDNDWSEVSMPRRQREAFWLLFFAVVVQDQSWCKKEVFDFHFG